jgi:uncharacterized protein YqeY
MDLKSRINSDMKIALKARDQERLDALRLLLAAIKQKEVDERIQLSDTDVIVVIEKMLKQRRDSITQFEAARRMDLADKEKFEVSVLQTYMPQPLSDSDLACMIDAIIAAVGATQAKDIGKVMSEIKSKLAGRADMGKASAMVKSKLSGGSA